jgi:hypothetical protein
LKSSSRQRRYLSTHLRRLLCSPSHISFSCLSLQHPSTFLSNQSSSQTPATSNLLVGPYSIFSSSIDVSRPINDQFNAPSSYELDDGDYISYRKVTLSHQSQESKSRHRRSWLVSDTSIRRIGGMWSSFALCLVTYRNSTSRTGICIRLTRLSPITTRLYNHSHLRLRRNLRFQACIHVQPKLEPTVPPIVP